MNNASGALSRINVVEDVRSTSHRAGSSLTFKEEAMKKIILFVFAAMFLAVLFLSTTARSEDTGTYEILDYKIKLTPKSNGSVEIAYYQKWKVTGGNIPWITVGTANDNFKIVTGQAQNLKEIKPVNNQGWSGVRIDLDRDYQPGQTFEISFTILQNKLFWSNDDLYHLDFTPGWYDNAKISSMTIIVHSFAPLNSVYAQPKPASKSGEEITWAWSNLPPGQQVKISYSFPKKTPGVSIPESSMKKEIDINVKLIIIVIIIVVIVLLVIFVLVEDGGGKLYSSGSVSYGSHSSIGSYGGSGGSSHSSGSSGRHSSGGGGSGGRSSGCACACVSCACACACAGGGGAGCSRKDKHNCRACKKRNACRKGGDA
jgi:uncharacterized membrane protein YgcG